MHSHEQCAIYFCLQSARHEAQERQHCGTGFNAFRLRVTELVPQPPPPASNSTLGMTTFIVIFFGSNLINRVGWRAGALATPLSMAALAAPLFAVVIAAKVKRARSTRKFAVVHEGVLAPCLAVFVDVSMYPPYYSKKSLS